MSGGSFTIDGGVDADRRQRRRGPALATIHPRAVALYRQAPEGSPRNVFQLGVAGIDPEGDRWRIRLAGTIPLVAEVTPAAAAELRLAEGGEVFAVVKATEIDVYRSGKGAEFGLQATPDGLALVNGNRQLTSGLPTRQAEEVNAPADAAQPASVDAVVDLLGAHDYLCDRRLATAILVAMRINKPLFLEGEAGVGKTEAARALAAGLGARLIRLQCYEGIDLAHAAYEWNYARQLLHIRLLGEGADRARAEQDVFGPDFLLRRPLLDAIDNEDAVPPVLLIDEIDRSDEEFEAFLLEILADFAISIPELRHDPRAASTTRDPHGQPNSRGPRRPQAPLPVSLDRLSGHRT